MRLDAAYTYLRHVRVRRLGVDAVVVLDVLEAVVHQAAVTAVVAPLQRAVNEVLLAEGDELARPPEVLALEGPGLPTEGANVQRGIRDEHRDEHSDQYIQPDNRYHIST